MGAVETRDGVVVTDKHFADWWDMAMGFDNDNGEAYLPTGLRTFFAAFAQDRTYDHAVLEQRLGGLAAWLLITLLSQADLLEYGTTVRYGWLTITGERVRDYVLAHTPEELEAILAVDYPGWTRCTKGTCGCTGHQEAHPCRTNPLWNDVVAPGRVAVEA